MTMETNAGFAMVLSVVLSASAVDCGGSTGNGPNYTVGSGGYGMPTGGFYPGMGGNGGSGGNGLATAGAGGGAGNSAICPAGLGPAGGLGGSGGTGDATDAGVASDGGGPLLPPGVHCADTTGGIGNDGGDLNGDWVCPVPSDPIWPNILPNGTTSVGVAPRLPCPSSPPAYDATFLWTSENPFCHTRGGTFADPTAGSTTFTCETAGDVTLTVYVGLRNTTCGSFASSWVVHCHL